MSSYKGPGTMDKLHWLDILILSIFLVISLAIGIIQALTGGRQKTIEEFFLDNRKLWILPTALSLFASLRSGVVVLASPAEVFIWGTQNSFVGEIIGVSLGALIVERFLVPWLYKLKLTSVFEYLQLRFQSTAVRRLASIVGIITSMVPISTSLLVPSVAMEVVSGLPMKVSMFLLVAFCTAYTALGGMRGIIWNDVLQAVIMLGGLIFVLVEGSKVVGDFQKVIDVSKAEGRLFFANFDPNPAIRSSFWTLLVGMTTTVMSYNGVQQMSVQRFVSLPSLRSARIIMLLFIPVAAVFSCVCAAVGLVQFAYFSKAKCDPIKSGLISSPNQLFPLFLKLHFINLQGTNGILLMNLYSSSLSTISSALSGIAANTWEDFLRPSLQTHVSEFQATLITKALVVLFALLGIGIAFGIAVLPSNLLFLTLVFLGVTGGPILGLFLLGGLTERTEWIGAMVGMLTGLLLNTFTVLGSISTNAASFTPLPPISIANCLNLFNATNMMNDLDITNLTHNYMGSPNIINISNSSPAFSPVKPLTGIKKVLSISNFMYPPIGAAVTFLVGYFVSVVIVHYLCRRPYVPVSKSHLISCKEAISFSQIYACDLKKSTTSLGAENLNMMHIKEEDSASDDNTLDN